MGLFVGRRPDGHGLIVSRQWNNDDYANQGAITKFGGNKIVAPLVWLGTAIIVGFAVSKILKL